MTFRGPGHYEARNGEIMIMACYHYDGPSAKGWRIMRGGEYLVWVPTLREAARFLR